MRTLQHHSSTLGADLIGEQNPDTGIANFKGIPYATVTKRWTQSSVRDSLPSPFDATNFGPKCPQALHVSIVPVGLENPEPGNDELACLNLNVTVPIEALSDSGSEQASGKLLPVIVWVHGGGFKNGSNSGARYNPLILSTLAVQNGHPVVIVQMNYRLGPFGFAASSDMASESPDYLSNFGLLDQVNAFQWVRNHIRDFGGDPNNVTALGLSAGSACLHFHILSGTPLFDRAILMSGSAPMMGPLPLPVHQMVWDKACKKAEISDLTPAQRLEKLRSFEPEALLQIFGSSTLTPLADGKLLPRSWKLGTAQPPTRCRDIIIGDTRVEAIIFDALVQNVPQTVFQQLVRGSFSDPADAEAFNGHFGFTAEEQPYEQFRDAIRFFLSTVVFHFPNLRVAETYPGNAYLYHFEEPSPYSGPTNGIPVHGQCAVFMYGNEKSAWPEGGQKTGQEMAGLWTAFAYGKEPWTPYRDSKLFMRFGPNGESGLRSFGDDEIRDYGYLDWLREHFEEVKKIVEKAS